MHQIVDKNGHLRGYHKDGPFPTYLENKVARSHNRITIQHGERKIIHCFLYQVPY